MSIKEKVIQKTIHIQAPVAIVWHALTDAQLIKEYMFGTTVQCSWEIGKPIVFTGIWEGKEYKDKGTILRLEKEKVLQYSYWSSAFGIPDTEENHAIVTFELRKQGESTELQVSQSNSPSETAYENSVSGWNLILDQLKGVVENSKQTV